MRNTAKMIGLLGMIAACPTWAATDVEKRAVLETYAEIANAAYEDSLITAKRLRDAIAALAADPSEATLGAARDAWRAARIPYQQTEAYRFGNAVDDDWEGKVNAWPLDEGLIDYVDRSSYGEASDENPLYAANVIANERFTMGGETIDASRIDKALLAGTLQEIGGIEANVATGYHAVEFLLWGQDLNGTGPGRGNRPATDFDMEACTGGRCDRRIRYLGVAADLLVDDLTWMTGQWAPGGAVREGLLTGDPDAGLIAMLTGMGSLSYGELAGERMKLGLMLHDPEEEHDCFSDNTHMSHYYDLIGIRNVYLGEYVRIDGRKVTGPSLSGLVAAANPEVDAELRERLDASKARMVAMVKAVEGGKAYDQLIATDDPAGNKIVQNVIDALTVQTRSIERAVAVLGLQAIAIEGSDSLDSPETVLK